MNKDNIYPAPLLPDLTLAVLCSIVKLKHSWHGERSVL